MAIHKLVAATVATALGGALALGLVACGSSNNSGAAAPASGQQQPPNSPRQGGPAASGTVAEVTASNMQVQGSSGQVTVNFSGDTMFTNRVSATLAEVRQGSCVIVTGTGQPVLARNVEISTATANGCGGGARPRNGTAQQRPSGSRAPQPSDANGARPVAGKVTAVTGNGFTVQEDGQQTGATTDMQVIVDANTTYGMSVSAKSDALKVGECVAATGQTDDTGAVTARTIAISQPGPNGCGVAGRQRTNNGGGNG